MKTILLRNSLSKEKETFKPLGEMVKIYSCGPTVYDYAHIGNFRSFLLSDLLERVLNYAGYKTLRVMNITDVGHLTNDDSADCEGEDKISKKAKAEKKDPYQIAQYYEKAFIEDEKALRIKEPQHRPRATDYIPEQIALTQDLIQKGYAYESNGSVYFRTKKFKTYGKLSGNNLEDLIAGARVEINSEKEDPMDFALWKKAEPSHLMQWDSPWGRGFPGWHLECSAMSKKLLGDYFDIHTGGEDNKFPHHECEIAQNECSCGHKSVNYWLHGKHLLVEGEKMSKSKGNFFTIKDLLEKGWKGAEIRYALMSAHYRSTLNFTEAGLESARRSIQRINEAYNILQSYEGEKNISETSLDSFIENYKESLFDDLNVPQALSAVFEILNQVLREKEHGTLSDESATQVKMFLENDFNRIFSVLEEVQETPAEIQDLLDQRQRARDTKNWAEADRLRDEIKVLGYEVLDGKDGQRVKKV